MRKDKKKLLIIAGEPSGDRHATDLVRELKRLHPEWAFHGIGGDGMAGQGVQLFYHIRQMAFLGLAEIVKHLPFIRSVFQTLDNWMRLEKPDAVILVDYPGFNLKLARRAKKLGIPVVYYICPQLWAWGERRVEKIRRFVDLPLVIFQFEEVFYQRYGISATFVGHPLVDELKLLLSREQFFEKHRLNPAKPLIALLPGSRENEVKSLLPVMVQAAGLVGQEKSVQWAVGRAGSVSNVHFTNALQPGSHIRLIEEDIHCLMKYAHLAVLASGTATLETGFLGTPMVVLYRVSPLTYWLGKRLVKIQNIALANIVSGSTVVPELIQQQVTPKNVAAEVNKYLTDTDYYRKVKDRLGRISSLLAPAGAAARAAAHIAEFLTRKKNDSSTRI